MNDCCNCKWAKWQMTNGKKPRITKLRPGRCAYKVGPMPLLPAVLIESGVESALESLTVQRSRTIWADNAYANCPVWEEK